MGVTFFLGSATFSSAVDSTSIVEVVGVALDKSKTTVRKSKNKLEEKF